MNDNNEANGNKADFKTELIYIGILVVLGIVLNFFFLGSMALWDTDEALYTEVAREMYMTGDYVTTRWNSEPWFCHPPLYFWMTTFFARIFGWTEFAARFGSAFFGLLFILLMYFFGKLMVNARTGFFTGLITAVIIQLWIQSRMALLDMPFLFFMVATVYFYFLGLFRENKYYFIGFWVCGGLAVLAKGPVGFILPITYVLFHLSLSRQWKRGIPLLFSWGVPIFLLISVPWYWLMAVRHGQPFVETTFGYFFFRRMVAPVMNQDGPWYYYIPFFLAGFLPWTAFLPLTFYFLGKNFSDLRSRFLLAWIVFTFLLFTFAGTKRPNYIIFIYPALAMALGWCVDTFVDGERFKKSSTISLVAFSISALGVIAAFIVAAVHFYPQYYAQYSKNLIHLTVPLILGGIVTLILTFKNKKFAFYAITAMAAVSYMVLLSYVPLVESIRPEPELARTIYRMKKEGDKLAMRGNFGRQFTIVYYSREPAIMFHSDDDLVKGLNEERSIFVIMHRKNFDKVRKRITAPVSIIKEKGKLVLFYTGETLSGVDRKY